MSKIAIVGSGVVGKATGMGFLSHGTNDVYFCDINKETLNSLRSQGYNAITLDELYDASFEFYMLSLPTPTNGHGVEVGPLKGVIERLAIALKHNSYDYPIVVIRSTVPPGTTGELLCPILETDSGLVCGHDFGIAFNPEFLRAGSADQDFRNPWITLLGVDNEKTWERLVSIYYPFRAEIFRLSAKQAEFQKYVHNLYNATKISFFNEMRLVAKHLSLDSESVFESVVISAEGMFNPPYGTHDYGPFGGACLPKDTAGFLRFAVDNDIPMPLLRAVIEVNEVIKANQHDRNIVRDQDA